MIPVDAIYTPVERVNVFVENTRVGQQTDYDKLTIEVTTNGTIKAEDALSMAAEILKERLDIFIGLSKNARNTEVMAKEKDIQQEQDENISVAELGFSLRAYNCLKRAGINTFYELSTITGAELEQIRGIDRKSFNEILGRLRELGITYATKKDNVQ